MNLMPQFQHLLLPYATILVWNFNIISNISKYATLSFMSKKVMFYERIVVAEAPNFSGILNGFKFASFSDIVHGNIQDQETVAKEEIQPYLRNDLEKEQLSIELTDADVEKLRCTFFNNYPRVVNLLSHQTMLFMFRMLLYSYRYPLVVIYKVP